MMLDLKKVLMDICYNDNITRREILSHYNKKYNKNVNEPTFSRSINTNVMKFNQLQNVLDSIDYEIIIQKKTK